MMAQLELGSAPSRLRRHLTSGRQELLLTIGATAAPAVLVLAVSAFIRLDAVPGGWRTRIWSELAEIAHVFPDAKDPMETIGALAGIAVAIIFYNARAELPDPDAGEASDEELERTSTILRTKSVLRLVAVSIAVGCWLLLLAELIRIVGGARTVIGGVELLALASLILLSCNFVTTQREEIAQRSLLAVDAALSAYDEARASGVVDRGGARPSRSLRRRSVILAAGLAGWFGAAVLNAREPVTVSALMILVVMAAATLGAHLAVLGLIGALRVSWSRAVPLAGLGLVGVPLGLAYVSVIGMIVLPPVTFPDPRDRAFFASTMALFILTAAAFWPVVDITADRKSRKLRAFIAARASRIERKGVRP